MESHHVSQAQRIVIKLGTQIVLDDKGELAHKRLSNLVNQCVGLVDAGKEIILVSSGAVGLGRNALKLGKRKLTLPEKQACAAIGQSLLMEQYRSRFGHYGLTTAQVLLSASDFSDRTRYLNLKETLGCLLGFQCIPIINENDTVSTAELEEDRTKSFGDNDKLSALVASKLDADLLVILTNVDGIYTANPFENPDAQKISLIEGFEQLVNVQTQGKSDLGRGGMASKIEAVKVAAVSGVDTLIASGILENTLSAIFAQETPPGTLIVGQKPLSGRKRWLGLASGYEGIVTINERAKAALVHRHASLLAVGIVGVQGDFSARQVVSIQDEQGSEIGRGLIRFSAEDTRKILGCHSHEIAEHLGPVEADEVIHRDNLVIFDTSGSVEAPPANS